MRDAFVEKLLTIAKNDSRVLLLTADLGFGVLDNFQRELPRQFINVGIAEQNMIGLATGLALEGNIVFCYSIGNFPTLRCLEQIRNDAAYHRANVKIVSIGGGLSYGPLGMSHHATEDIAILRVIPGVEVIVPSTLKEASDSAQYLYASLGVQYLRLDKSSGPSLSTDTNFNTWPVIREGTDVCLISSGGILEETIEAAEILEKEGVSAKLISAINLNLKSNQIIKTLVLGIPLVFSVEEHVTSGGLGGLIAEAISDSQTRSQLIRLGVTEEHIAVVGTQKYLRSINGISAEAIVEIVLASKLSSATRE